MYAGSWMITGHFSAQVLRLVSNLILTRLLVPEMFGLMSAVSVVLIGINMFSDIGLLQNIVQSQRGSQRLFLNTAWTIQIIRGFLIYFIAALLCLALYFVQSAGILTGDTVYADPTLPILLAIAALSAPIFGFLSVNIFVQRRNLAASKITILELSSQVIGLIVTIFLAWLWRDIWALLLGNIVSAVIKVAGSHLKTFGDRPALQLDRSCAKEILNFGKWVFVGSIFGFCLNHGDRLLLGGLVTAKVLGIYNIAYFLAMAAKELLFTLFKSIFFPVLSETFRNAPQDVERIYYKIRIKIDGVSMFAAGFLFASGTNIIKIMYDDRYHEAGHYLEILGLSLVATGFSLANQCFLAHGKAKLTTALIASQVFILYTVVPLAFVTSGINGVIWAIAATPVANALISLYLMKKYLFLNLKREFIMLPMILAGYAVGALTIAQINLN
jgi:Membrane protein involved in the export of O-antigen and teichoic acid